MVKKVIPSTRNNEQSGGAVQERRIPRYLNTAQPNTGNSGRPSRERHIPSYLNDYFLV